MAVQSNELAAAVLQKIETFVPDALEKETKLTSILTGEGKKQQKGGLFIQCPIKLIANAAQGFISGTSNSLPMDPGAQLQYMVFNWKYYNHNVNFTLADYNIAQGPQQIVDFMETKIEGALSDSVRQWSLAFNGTAASPNGLNFQGIKDICAATGTAYGSLTDTDYASGSFLPLYYTAAAHGSTLTYSLFNKMATDLRLRVKGFGKGKKIMATLNGLEYSALKTALQNQQVFFNESDFIKAGFVGFSVDGVDVYPDADAPGTGTAGTADNWLTMFPTDIMKFYYNYGFGTKSPFDGEVRVPNQTIMSYQSFTTGEVVCPNRRLIAAHKELA